MIKTTPLAMLIGVVEVLKVSGQIIDASRYDAAAGGGAGCMGWCSHDVFPGVPADHVRWRGRLEKRWRVHGMAEVLLEARAFA